MEPGPEQELTRHYRIQLRSCGRGLSPPSLGRGLPPPSLGRGLHCHLIKSGLLRRLPSLSSALFHFYSAVGSPSDLLRSFRSLSLPSTPDWTALISSFSRRLSLPSTSLCLFRLMRRRSSAPPDSVCLLSLLYAASRLSDPDAAATAHVLFIKLGIPFSIAAYNTAVLVYGKCGLVREAWMMFDEIPEKTVVSWTVLLTTVLKWEGIDRGRQVFDKMPLRNEVSWCTMVCAYIEAGLVRDSLSLLAHMVANSIRNLNHISFCSLLSACSQSGDLCTGQWVHVHVLKTSDFDENESLMVSTSLIDMYSKCGRIESALKVFESTFQKNIVVWNAILSGLSLHGMGREVLNIFQRMISDGTCKPDDITFVSLLTACSRSGLIKHGRKLFHDLTHIYGLTAKVEHYACMVDLLGRAGHLDEAKNLVRDMLVKPNEVVLGSLIASCSLHGKLDLAKQLMHELVQLYPNNTEYHILFSNLCTTTGKHSEADFLRKSMQKQGIRKSPGISYIEIHGCMHKFTAGDKSHPLTRELYVMLDEVMRRLCLAGYIPDVSNQISRVEEDEERELLLLVHSERLAVCLGLLSTKPGSQIRIFKNLRICSDCHTVMKLISGLYEREIIVRDRNRFHSFKNGSCSCSDYW